MSDVSIENNAVPAPCWLFDRIAARRVEGKPCNFTDATNDLRDLLKRGGLPAAPLTRASETEEVQLPWLQREAVAWIQGRTSLRDRDWTETLRILETALASSAVQHGCPA